MAVDEKALEEKIASGGKLTEEETSYVMSSVDEEAPKIPGTQEDEGDEFKDVQDIDDKAASGKKDEDAKPAGEEKAGDATGAAAKAPEKTDDKGPAAAPAPSEKKEEKAEEGIYQKIEKELEKPEGQEDLTGLSEREKGLYYALKSERKKRQKVEEDRDETLFRDLKTRKAAEAKAEADKKAAAQAKEDEIDIKISGEDDEFITVKEAKSIVDALKKVQGRKAAAPEAGDVDEVVAANRTAALRIAAMSARDVIEARTAGGQKDMPDFDLAMKIGEILVEENPEYQKAIYAAYKSGKNPALLTYDLVRKDPKFATLYGKKSEEKPAEDKAKAGKENLEKLEENAKKPKTSGAQGAAGSSDSLEGYTLQQLADMSPSQFRKVPKHIRQKFLFNT